MIIVACNWEHLLCLLHKALLSYGFAIFFRPKADFYLGNRQTLCLSQCTRAKKDAKGPYIFYQFKEWYGGGGNSLGLLFSYKLHSCKYNLIIKQVFTVKRYTFFVFADFKNEMIQCTKITLQNYTNRSDLSTFVHIYFTNLMLLIVIIEVYVS